MARNDVGHCSFFGSFTLQCNIAGVVALGHRPLQSNAIMWTHLLKFYKPAINDKLTILVMRAKVEAGCFLIYFFY